jgi:hypothetical protein
VTWTVFRQHLAANPHPCFLRQDAGAGGGTGDKPAGEADKPDGDKPDGTGDKPAAGKDDDDDDEPLGEAGKGALRKERELRRQAQRDAEAAAKTLAETQARLEALETADMDETQRQLRRLPELETQVSTLTSQLDQATAALAEERLERAVEREAARSETRFQDPEDALAFIDQTAIETDDEGKPKPGSIRRELKRILEAKPHLAAAERDAPPPADETPAAPAGSTDGRTADDDAQAKEASRGFLRRRI